MKCFNCNYTKLTKDMKNCPICGVGLSKTCNKCDSFNPSSAKFCFECGSVFEISEVLNEEKIQKIGVIFADISGFTTLAETFNPEETKEIINECFDTILEPVYRTGGKIDKYIGDCVMVVFGLDDEYDVPTKTIECALEMRKRMKKFINIRFPKKDVLLDISIGATYGEVISGNVGTKHDSDHTIVGDIVNVASRLQNLANPGQILVNELLYNETKNLVLFGDVNEVKLKNKSELVKSYNAEVLYSKVEVNDVNIMREEELLFKKFLESTEGTTLQILGESGSGKTTLALKVLNNFNSIIITQPKIDIEIPYNLLKRVIGNVIGISFKDDEDSIKKKLEIYIKYILRNLDEEEIMRNYNFISLLLKVELDNEFRIILNSMDYQDLENETFEQFDLFIKESLKHENFVLLIDNADFIDNKSLKLLKQLDNFESKIIFVSKTKVIDEKESKVLNLKNFDLNQTTEFTLKFFKTNVSNILNTHLYELTNGNPFYLNELCKVINKSVKTYENNELVVSNEILNSLPTTLSKLYKNVFNSIEENFKKYLYFASVFMNEFDSRLIHKLNNSEFLEEAELLLQDLNIIEIHSYYRFEGKTFKKFIFKHSEFKKSIYSGLLKKDQKKYHLKLAKHYENNEGDFESIAYHYEATGNIKIAKEYVYKHAVKFKKSFNTDQATLKYLKYLDFEADLENYLIEPRVVETIIEISKIMLYKSNFEEAIKYINEGLDICQSDDEQHQLQLLLIEYYKATTNIEEIFPVLDELEKNLQKTSRNYGKLLQLKCTIFNMIGKPGVIELADKSKEILLRAKDFDNLAETLTQAGIRYFIQGDISNGITYLESALDYANQGNNKSLPAKIMSNLGILYNVFGEREKAHSYFTKSMKLSLVISNNRNYISTAINLGVSYLKSGSFNNAKSVLEKSVETSKKAHLLYQLCVSLTNLADVNYELGEYDTAMELYSESKSLSNKMNLPIEKSINDLGILKVKLKTGKTEKSNEIFNEIIKTFEEGEEYSYVANAYYTMSDYSISNKDINSAIENIDKGISFTEKSKSEEDEIKLKRKKMDFMYISKNLEIANSMFEELTALATKSHNYYELTKLYLSKHLYSEKKSNDNEYLMKALELSQYFDNCSITNTIESEISKLKNN